MAKKEKKPRLWFEEPFEGMKRAEEDFHKNIDRFWREPFRFFPGKELSGGFARTVLLKLADSNKELIVRAELPGFKKDEISLKVTENAIFLAAEKKKQKLEQAKGFLEQKKATARHRACSRCRILSSQQRQKQNLLMVFWK